jgi:hypothetical protein
MDNTKTKQIQKHQNQARIASESLYSSQTTVMLLASYTVTDCGDVELSYGGYIYQHRDICGRVIGITISDSILNSHVEFDGKYLQGVDMTLAMYLYKDDICEFSTLFEDEFESMFSISPTIYFEAQQEGWLDQMYSI